MKTVECTTCGNATEFYMKHFEMNNPVMYYGKPQTMDIERWTFCAKCHGIHLIEVLERDIPKETKTHKSGRPLVTLRTYP